ncbi:MULTISPECIES: hypothetical protein [unclassified Curtobacterium]|uniref:hypothetical protein n=1 Tax=unclassified Curtobacterium TaxID=257496 RepID=UPI00226B14DE|nr:MULTISPECIES: hypothetical protein [unclassified Curtobacterium]
MRARVVATDRIAAAALIVAAITGELLQSVHFWHVIWLVVTMLRGPFTGDHASSARHCYPCSFPHPDHFANLRGNCRAPGACGLPHRFPPLCPADP